ncbi:MAG: hypothetical protein UR88_C0003G0001 [Candidatus Nomurabacteria bacterium GW2011_GWA1_35_8]|uniref:O-antigen ligase-related domain-containing protein n=1 Tax=Candidatus Nomurabacteria bacterium GW2011_GWA1_35_8 TaxID=1618727 RepID=A0A0G0CXX7_9BACT|nr:MAG: hypothetical protein UR88_C0003G0001 [Candidatus Nomurabacteria bacterium GW2011_GWA1_35_8]
MKKIIEKIKSLSSETINKNLIFIAILFLLFRIGNFTIGYIPKPFELIVLIIVLLTIIDVLKNNKIKEFFFSIPKNIRIALICLVFSVLFGWAVSILKGIPTTFNMILEFGSFVFSLSIFLLILFYTKNDKIYIKKYFYALLIPIIYVIFVIFPELAYLLKTALEGHFVGFTTNPNIISKVLLIPIIFFSVKTLFEEKNKWFKLGYFALASLSVSLLFWTSSRGAILSLILGMIFIWLIFSFNHFNWGKLLKSGVTIFLICLLGFILTSKGVKEGVANRIFNTKIIDIQTKNKPIIKIVDNKTITEILNNKESVLIKLDSANEIRLQIWSFYLRYLSMNPFGVGPNTHMNFNFIDNNGYYIRTGPHNTYIQILFWGGIVGLFSFIYILFFALKNLKIKLQSNFNILTISLMAILFSLSISITFDDSLSFYWFYIILALSLAI